MTTPLVWLIGPSGVGKSTIGYEVFTRLYRSGTKAGYVDLDQIGLCYPQPDHDPNNHGIKAANLAVVWSTYRAAGARVMLVCGGAERADLVPLYKAQVPDTAPLVVRLRASADTIRARVFRRGVGAGPAIPGAFADVTQERLERIAAEAISEAESLDRDDFADINIDTDDVPVSRLADQVLARCGLTALLARSNS